MEGLFLIALVTTLGWVLWLGSLMVWILRATLVEQQRHASPPTNETDPISERAGGPKSPDDTVF